MTARQRIALLRLALIAAAWALGNAIVWQLGTRELGYVVPPVLAAGAYLGTRDIGPGGRRGAPYWRGRPIDRDRWH